jgi:hypothetical protein
LFPRMLPVKLHHQTSYLSQVLRIVNTKSQCNIYFISGKVFLNKMCTKLNHKFKYSCTLEKVSFTLTKHI